MTSSAPASGTLRRPGARRRVGGLVRQRDFGLFWLAESVTRVGTAVMGIVLPLFALDELHAGPVTVGLLMAATWAPYLVIGLQAGAWVDRLPRRPILIWASTLSSVAICTAVVAAWADVITLAQLLLTALVVGGAGVFASTASAVYLPSLVSREDLVEGNAKLQASESVALILGPSLGGVVSQIAGPSSGLLAGGIGFACSAVCLLFVRGRGEEVNRDPGTALLRQIIEGVRLVAGDTLLRVMTVTATLANLAMSANEAVMVVFLVRTVGVSASSVGLLLTCWGVGGLVGALLVRRVAAAIGTGRTLLATAVVTAPFGLLVPMTTAGAGLVLFVVGALVPSMGVAVYNTVSGTFRQSYCEPTTLGRITGTMRFVLFGTVPVGALAGGALAASVGPRDALWVAMAVNLVPAVVLLVSPIRRMRDLPVRE